MSVIHISIPPIPEYRGYIKSVLHYVEACIISTQTGAFPRNDIEKIVTQAEVHDLFGRLARAGDSGEMEITEKDVLLSYCCYNITSKVMLTEHGEKLSGKINDVIPEKHPLKNNQKLRDFFLEHNSHLIRDIEKKFRDKDHIAELKKRISELEF